MDTGKKYVVVLAHADGWGALSANKLLRHLHENYPDVGVHLIVSQATKTKEGKIATKLNDLKIPRELKETNLLEYFRRIDEIYEHTPSFTEMQRILNGDLEPKNLSGKSRAEYAHELGMRAMQRSLLTKGREVKQDLLTFKQLGRCFCSDEQVHYTTRGGPRGGEEVASIVSGLEERYGHGPEVLLSVDTMAILPKELLEKHQCFSTHPGPLDTIKVEGMQGTLRSLANQVLYNINGEPYPADFKWGFEPVCLKGTLFMQHPELDKGPPVDSVVTPVPRGMCAYQARDEMYDALVEAMMKRLPTLLDTEARQSLVENATLEKEKMDKLEHRRVAELEDEQFATWQRFAIGMQNDDMPWGVEVFQNQIIRPEHFAGQMQRFFPGSREEFTRIYGEVYGQALGELEGQRKAHADGWTRLFQGEPGIEISQLDPKTGEVLRTFRNPPTGRE